MNNDKKELGNSKFAVCISKEELNMLPPEKFSGDIVTIEEIEEADRAIGELEKASLVGFDTETKPNFHKGQVNKVALLQLATGDKCYLFRLSKIGIPPSVKAFLENKDIAKVGLSLRDDFHSLGRLIPIEPGGFIDIQEMVKDFKITDSSLTKIHAILFGKRISKSQQLTNWEAPSLTQKQKEYAALDAIACINIYNHFRAGRFVPEDSQYYKEIPTDGEKTI